MAIIKPTSQVALVPFYYLVPVVLALCLLSAFAANFAFADFVTLGILATLGYFMKQNGWPRAPLVLGFVLGSRMELFLWLSIARYGLAWLAQPVVIVLLLLVAFTVAYPFIQQRRAARAQSKVGDRL
jgi:TctA family transporter